MISLESYYEINVSLKGRHFFATAPRSIKYLGDLDIVVDVFKEKFPESEGYSINVTHWKGSGTTVEI